MTSEEGAQKFHTDDASLGQELGSVFDWLKQIFNHAIRSTTQIWVVKRHQNGISALISQTSFRGKTSGGIYKCQLFPHAVVLDEILSVRNVS